MTMIVKSDSGKGLWSFKQRKSLKKEKVKRRDKG